MTVFSNTFDILAPDGGDDPAEADNNMRRIQAAVQERENVDHYWPLTGTEVSDADTDEHRKITIRTLTADEVAALSATKAYLYRLVTDGELYFKDASDNTIQITSDGTLLVDVLADGAILVAATESADPDRTIVDLGYAKTGDTVQHDAEGGYQNADVNGTKTKVYTKYFTGTTDISEETVVAHGVTGAANILSVTVSIFNNSLSKYFVSEAYQTANPSPLGLVVKWDATNVVLSHNGFQFEGQAYTIRVDYKLP